MAAAVTHRRAWLLRLRCECGRNVADVSATGSPPTDLQVHHRVPVDVYPAGAPAPTYNWHCPCGQEHRRRHTRLVSAYLGTAAGRVDYLTLNRDM
jgi:hypothetical protein